jgi:Holliday junction resolvasome RuvABC endonuclease subunit
VSRIVGIDLSLTGTGLCEINGEPATDYTPAMWAISTSVVTSSGKTADTLVDRFARQTKICTAVLTEAKGADLVVIEYPVSGKYAGHLIDRAGLWWRIVGSLQLWDVPVVSPIPSQAKKFLTGSGNAPKGEVVRWAGKVWPEWEPSSGKNIEDEADAVAMASIGLGMLWPCTEWPFSLTQYRTELVATLAHQFNFATTKGI